MSTEIIATTPESEIVNSRVFAFNRNHVFRAWEEAEHLQNWWGPAGFTNTFNEFDFRVGGKWKFVMHGPDKGNYVNEVEFISIVKPKMIAWKRHSKPLFQIVALFEEISETETRLVFKMLFDTAEECQKLRPFVVDKNEENFDKLERELTAMSH